MCFAQGHTAFRVRASSYSSLLTHYITRPASSPRDHCSRVALTSCFTPLATRGRLLNTAQMTDCLAPTWSAAPCCLPKEAASFRSGALGCQTPPPLPYTPDYAHSLPCFFLRYTPPGAPSPSFPFQAQPLLSLPLLPHDLGL